MISLPPQGDTAKKLGSYFAPLKVEAQATPNMTVKVAEGAFWTATNKHMEYIGGSTTTISAPGSDAKWVLITVKSTGSINIVDGVASATPVLPAASNYADELPLAALFVGDTTTAITNDMIYDIRPMWSIPLDGVTSADIAGFATTTDLNSAIASLSNPAGTNNADFTLNVGGAAMNQSGLTVDRNAGADVGIRFNELAQTGSPLVTTPMWEFTNDGATWNPIGVSTGSYYSKGDLDGGALNAYYYTETELSTTGVLDSRYYTETESDALFAADVHTHLIADITDFTAQVQTVNSVAPTAGNIQLGLNELDDVVEVGAADKHVLVYTTSTADYRNRLLNTDDLGDVDTTAAAPIAGDVLVHTGTIFANRVLVKADISNFVETDYVITGSPSVAQDVYGVKTFKDGITIETSLTVSGASTSIETTDLRVTDSHVDINYGELADGVGGGSGTAGIRISRGLAGSPQAANPDAVIQWDEALQQWEVGVVGNADAILTGAHTHISTDVTDFSSAITARINVTDLVAIQDVTLAGVADGDYLRRSAAAWENSIFATDVTTELGSNNLDTISDVAYTGSPALAAGQTLLYNGSIFQNNVLVKSNISDFVESDYIHITGDEAKTGDLALTGDLSVSGTTTTLDSTIIQLTDPFPTVNYGEVGDGVANGTGTAGISIARGYAGSPLVANTPARLYWNELTQTWIASFGSAATLVELSFIGHNHLVADITDISATALELNHTTGVTSNIQSQSDDKISRTGDAMDNSASLTFAVGGEVLGLPASPSATGASSKEYVDTEITTVTGSLSTHTSDATMHITADQNALLDALVIGSPATLATEIGHLDGLSTNAQTQLDAKSDNGHNHTASDVTDFNTALDTYLTGTAVIDDISDVNVSSASIDDLIQLTGGGWANIAPSSIAQFTHAKGSVDESIDGIKTFTDNVVLSGTTTRINSTNIEIADQNITINAGYSGATSGSTGSGITVDRNSGTGSPLVVDLQAVIVWDDSISQFKAGIAGSETEVATVGVTPMQPHYENIAGLSGSPSTIYDLAFDVPLPSAGKTELQVFVDGVKYVEGAAKGYTVSGHGTGNISVTFNAGYVPSAGVDVEFYGFGYIG